MISEKNQVRDGVGDTAKWRVWFRDDIVAQFDTKEEANEFEARIYVLGLVGVTMVLEPK